MPKLVVHPSTTGSHEFPLGPGANYAGRGYNNNVKIEDPSVSNVHAQIIVEQGRVIIKDLGSMNGTYINGAPVKEAELHAGESLRLGAVELVFQDDKHEPELVEGVPIPDPIAAEALRAARERLGFAKKK